MARPSKNTVSYFPHPVNDGTRMFIMEERFGDKGYCFYYKLLQFLGKSDNHFIDYKIPKNKQFLCSLIRCSDLQFIEMINVMVEIEALDKDLWNEKMIIWSSDFIESIEGVYRSRKSEIPKKPPISENICQADPISPTNNSRVGAVSSEEKPQSKVKYSKVNESKENQSKEDVFESLKLYFGFEDELKHISKWSQISAFLNSLLESGQFSNFENQFAFYKKYKDKSGEKTHSFLGFIEGGWDSENWEHKYKNFKSEKKDPKSYTNTGKNYYDGLPNSKQ